jgi:threonine dehydrogenase-like Zn-dependent dehydrogenase
MRSWRAFRSARARFFSDFNRRGRGEPQRSRIVVFQDRGHRTLSAEREFPTAVEMISSGALNVKPLVTHQMPYTQAQGAYSLFAERRDG